MGSVTGTALGGFLVLHGLVHLWFVTLAQRWIEFQADMGWTADSWLLREMFELSTLRGLATGAYALAAVAFITAGAGVALGAVWTRPALGAAGALSTAAVIGFWSGGFEMPVQKGLIAIIINLGVLGALLLTD